jgi:hypothetical protein
MNGLALERTSREYREIERDELRFELSETSHLNWCSALDLFHMGWASGGSVEEDIDLAQEASLAQNAHCVAYQLPARRWYAAQIKLRRQVTIQELAERLGAQDEAQARAMLHAWAFDLFHLHRQLWRALKHTEAQEAGLTFEEALSAVKREERRLKRIWARPAAPAAPARLKRPRPIEHRPQVQPNAPTN